MQPVVMPPNRLVHFYLGGRSITRLRHVPAPAERSPEEWLASATARFGEHATGLSTLPGGGLLRDAVAADPVGWLGREALPGGPGDVGVLVKLLDAGQRLPVHVHPDRDFAGSHLGSCYGKTEAWFVLDTDDELAGGTPQVHVGFREDVDPADLLRAVDEQDPAWMLERLNAVDVRRGDVVLVPAGTAHAIGAGIFLLEIQEPSDFSVLLEWEGFGGPDGAWVGLDREVALGVVEHRATGPDELARLCRRLDLDARVDGAQRVLPEAADGFFRADLIAPADAPVVVPAGFGVLVVLAGEGRLHADGTDTALASGDVVAVPHSAGDISVTGPVTAVLCRGAGPVGTS